MPQENFFWGRVSIVLKKNEAVSLSRCFLLTQATASVSQASYVSPKGRTHVSAPLGSYTHYFHWILKWKLFVYLFKAWIV